MDFQNCKYASSLRNNTTSISYKVPENPQFEGRPKANGHAVASGTDVNVDFREVYFLIMHFLSAGPCQKTFAQFLDELTQHQLLPRRYHAWYSRSGAHSGDENDDGASFPLTYEDLLLRYPHVAKDHLVRLLRQLMLSLPRPSLGRSVGPNAADVPTLLGTGSFSLLSCDQVSDNKEWKLLPGYLRWPHKQVDQVHGLHLRALGGGFTRHLRGSSIHAACFAIAKPSTMVQKMQNITRLRGHRNAVYCAIFDRSGRYVITGSDDRLVKIWSMETAFCLSSCRGHEGDITDLAVSSNNSLVASASNDYVIRVWRLPDGLPISVLQGHTGAVTAIVFSPKPGSAYQLLSSSDDGTCRIWDARSSHCKPRIYAPKPVDAAPGIAQPNHQILCCAYNANGTVFVTGSSDTFARVWSACKSNSIGDSEQPIHEIDVLAGHENDVNYVQFSGCAISPRSANTDALKEDYMFKFKNSGGIHDNIVTCSRDGSAIIWISRSRKSHGKVGRWTKAYHLKVPPPPLPPQPPRGGPRRRILPTPRGVNMIVWSLDNRFVLAAIMDCRICVWNASDGSLVHSLTGHTDSTYVLDVHPFNPRIAMSAGYDGKTIIWDIWEGTPVRVFEIGRGKLVDGKFSSDGTSIVLSDDVGQIYLLNTGQGESQRDAKYDQFFLGDYRPLVRDAVGNALDQESQLIPYRRNLQDLLCDSSMMPYPEPYQSMYQRRRLGALGIEWRPLAINFAIGPDFSLGEEFQMPLPDPEAIIDLPESLDAILWEPENDAVSDDADTDYDVAEEYSSAKDQESLSTSSYGDGDTDTDSDVLHNFENKPKQKDGLRRSKRKNERAEVELNSSGRRIRRRSVEDCNEISLQSNRGKKPKTTHKASKKKYSKAKLSRPRRVAAINARSVLARKPETSSSSEDEDGSEIDISESDSYSQDSTIQVDDFDCKSPDIPGQLFDESSATVLDTDQLPEAQSSVGNNRKLVLKLSIRGSKHSLSSESTRNNFDDKRHFESSSSLPISLADEDRALLSSNAADQKLPGSANRVKIRCKGLAERIPDHASLSVIDHVGSSRKMTGSEDDVIERDVPNECCSEELKESDPTLPTRIKIKSSSFLKQDKTTNLNSVTGAGNIAAGEVSLVPRTNAVSHCDRNEENLHNTSSYYRYSDVDLPDAETDIVRRSRSIEIKASTRDPERGSRKLKLKKSDVSAGTSKKGESSSTEWVLNSNISDRSRSTRSRLENLYKDEVDIPETSQSSSTNKKISWLLLSEHEPGYRYIPQLGDEVVYLIQGHQEYLETSGSHGRGPWGSMKGQINDVEVCLVEGLDYATAPGSGESCCKLVLKFIDQSSSVYGKVLRFTLPELNVPDFLVEKTWYDASITRNWAPRDMCSVWWRNENGEGGNWWEGWIISSEAKSSCYPDSPWERYAVKYKNDPDPQLHSPWELHDPNARWEPPHIHFDTRSKFLDSLLKLDRRYKDSGISKLEQVSQRPDFLNRYPVPLSLNVIRSRLKNNYYRNLKALRHDIDIMMSNAKSYFSKTGEISKQMRRLEDNFDRIFTML